MGGAIFDTMFCSSHSGVLKHCTNSVDCSVRSLWQMVQYSVDELLDRVTLQDLIGSEKKSDKIPEQKVDRNKKEVFV